LIKRRVPLDQGSNGRGDDFPALATGRVQRLDIASKKTLLFHHGFRQNRNKIKQAEKDFDHQQNTLVTFVSVFFIDRFM
jgi:hypothetical protein